MIPGDGQITEIEIGFEEPKKDINDFAISLFEAGMRREGLEKNVPGEATIVLNPMKIEKLARLPGCR